MQPRKFEISFLKKIDSKKASSRYLTFDEISDEFKSELTKEFKNKEQLGCFVGGELTDGKRSSEYLKCRSIITYDIDNYNSNLDVLVNYIEKSLLDYTYIYYTTASSSFDRPRMRVLLFLNNSIPPANYNKLVTDTANLLFSELVELDKKRVDGEKQYIDDCSYKALYAMYTPSKVDLFFRYKENKGQLIDTSSYQTTSKESIIKYKTESEEFESFSKLAVISSKSIDSQIVDNVLSHYDCASADYHNWLNVGIGLHHNYSGSKEGLDKFIEWSLTDTNIENKGRYRNKSVEIVCAEKYKSIKLDKNNPLTFASVIKIVNEQKKTPSRVDIESFKSLDARLFPHFKINPKTGTITLKNTIENFRTMLNGYNIKISYDIITKRNVNSLNIKDNNVLIDRIESLLALNNLSERSAGRRVYSAGMSNPINSFKQIMDNVIWDGQDRIEDFYNTITVKPEHEHLKRAYLDSWIKQMLYLGLHEGQRKVARSVLVFQSKQEIGKSTWIKSLLPEHISSTYIGSGVLDLEKDMKIYAAIKFLVFEMAELGRSLRRNCIDAFKAFVTETHDTLNIKYVDYPVEFMRTTSLFGTINEDVFLRDKTGSTRFYVLPVIATNGHHSIDQLQLLKQYLKTKNIVKFELSKEDKELQRILNKQFEYPDVIEDDFFDVFEKTATDGGGEWRNCKEILIQLGYNNSDQKNLRNELSWVLKNSGFKRNPETKKFFVELKNNKH